MPAQLEIVLIDSGESAQAVVDRTNGSRGLGGERGPQVSPPGGSSASDPDGKGASVFDSVLGLARALGVGGMITQVFSVTKALYDLYNAVNEATNAHRSAAAEMGPQAGGSRVVDSQVGPNATEAKASQPFGSESNQESGAGAGTGSSSAHDIPHSRPTAPPGRPTDGPRLDDYIEGDFEVKRESTRPSLPKADGPKAQPRLSDNAPSPNVLPQRPGPAPALTGPPAANGAMTVARAGGMAATSASTVTAAGSSLPAVAGSAAGLPAIAGAAAPTAGAAAAGATALLGPLAVVGAALIGAAAAVKVFDSVMHDQAEKLAGYSMELSKAQANSNLQAEMADIRRAERISPQLAQFENDRTRVMTALADIGTSVLQVLLQIYEANRPAIEGVIKGMEVYSVGLELQTEIMQAILEAVTLQPINDNLNRISAATNKMAKVLTTRDEDTDMVRDPYFDALLAGADGSTLKGDMPVMGAAAPLGV